MTQTKGAFQVLLQGAERRPYHHFWSCPQPACGAAQDGETARGGGDGRRASLCIFHCVPGGGGGAPLTLHSCPTQALRVTPEQARSGPVSPHRGWRCACSPGPPAAHPGRLLPNPAPPCQVLLCVSPGVPEDQFRNFLFVFEFLATEPLNQKLGRGRERRRLEPRCAPPPGPVKQVARGPFEKRCPWVPVCRRPGHPGQSGPASGPGVSGLLLFQNQEHSVLH